MAIPHDGSPDSTLALMREGYLFIGRRSERLGSDIFRTRIMLREAICIRGAAAAELFYGGDRFTRVGAMPITVLKLLQDRGSVQLMEGDAHRARKRMFMSLMTPDQVARLAQLTETEWRRRFRDWELAPEINLFNEMRSILASAVCAWAGVPLNRGEADERTREMSEMIESTGSVGPRNWRALMLRRRSERWARDIIRRVRRGALAPPEGSALRTIASHQRTRGKPLSAKVAGVELLNVLRPTVAVARFVVFAALALHERPELRRRLASAGPEYLDAFAEEVRRHTPFFPFIGGRAKQAFEWGGHHFKRGAWVLLDLYGTNHDPRSWEAPEAFRPERFLGGAAPPFASVPQGGGDPREGHRCPGEPIALELLKVAARMFVAGMRYEVPPQDLSVDLGKIPALPASGFRMRAIRRVSPQA